MKKYNLVFNGVILNKNPYLTKNEVELELGLIIINYGYKPEIQEINENPTSNP